MMFVRALSAELLKLKRTIAAKLVVLAPLSIVVLVLFLASQSPFSTLGRMGVSNEWTALTRVTLMLWTLLLLPLYMTIESALVAGLDHAENQWKSLFARPVPRWTVYVAKFIVVYTMTSAGTVVLVCGVLIDGWLLPRLQAEYRFQPPVPVGPIFRMGLEVAGLAFLALAIQHWVSLRFRSFAVAVATGVMGMVVAYVAVIATHPLGGWPQYFPWALPMLVLSGRPHDLVTGLWVSGLFGLAAMGIGCWDFCRREVQ
ncbi:MAG: ABC transporter permease [Bryobacterales bacterium]|nr:ABC transporter permease [Bryobacterales bacterium]